MEYLYSAIAGVFLAATILILQPGAEQQQIVAKEQAPATGEQWQVDVLAGIGNDKPAQAAVDFLAAWHRAEGGTAAYNWLNTTQGATGATDYNSVGVKNYPSYEAGIQATVETLTNGFYPRTLEGLRTNQPVVDDAEMGTWGTGAGAVRAQLEETRATNSVSLPSAFASNPISIGGDDCGWNVQVAIEANGGALRDVRIEPGSTFSFNATMGTPALIPYRTCAGVPGGNWCNLAARYSQVARALGLSPQFQDHGVGDLGGGPENSVAIWNEGGIAGAGQDLLIQNTTNQAVWFRASDVGGAVVIEGGFA